MEPQSKEGHSCKIGGINVQFPTTPYPSQIGCMNMLIQGLKRGHNCLLESPTGSGKTLAMLSAALAWQLQESEKANEHNAKVEDYHHRMSLKKGLQTEALDSSFELTQTKDGEEDGSSVSQAPENTPSESTSKEALPVVDLCETDDSDDDFKQTPMIHKSKVRRASDSRVNKSTIPKPLVSDVKTSAEPPKADILEPDDGKNKEQVPQRMTVPKIFFATRTHQQIAQVTQELRKTAYKGVRSVILSSRENYCINPIVSTKSNKNEACKELLDFVKGGGCGWHSAAKKLGDFSELHYYGLRTGYDLEDFVRAGVQAKACPYFASRYLMEEADLILCPYNYLIDPHIRASMKINLTGEVVIFDEGHNMEDASRESVSYSVDQKDIQEALQNCEKMVNCNVERLAHEILAQFLSEVSLWIDQHQNNLVEIDFNTTGQVWNGTEAVASLDINGITMERINKTLEQFKAIMAAKEAEFEALKQKNKKDPPKPSLNSKSVQSIENVFRIFDYLIREDGRYRLDFRVALLSSSANKRNRNTNNGSSVTLNLWCLDPSIAFSQIHSVARCVIITSGTLSPFDSFQSELGCPFPTKLECQHIIRPDQIFARVIHTGRRGVELKGVFQNTNSFDYQDEIGNVILEVCNTVPFGVLVFLPSYRMLDVFKTRWELTGKMNEFRYNKVVFFEPRSGQTDFLETIESYYSTIKECSANPVGSRGALFFAVCRGKVSEGLNFSDNNARAVVCIGIPFPNARDMQVVQKKSYNDANRAKGLLSGGKWYEIQAFRALNQAMGRCIRHKNDFGAVFLLDSRFREKGYLAQLPKWFRTRVTYSRWDDNAVAELEEYVSSMQPLMDKLKIENSQANFTLPPTDDGFSSQSQNEDPNEESHFFSGMKVEENTWKSPEQLAILKRRRAGPQQEQDRTPSMKRQREEDEKSSKGGASISPFFTVFNALKKPQGADAKKSSSGFKKMML